MFIDFGMQLLGITERLVEDNFGPWRDFLHGIRAIECAIPVMHYLQRMLASLFYFSICCTAHEASLSLSTFGADFLMNIAPS